MNPDVAKAIGAKIGVARGWHQITYTVDDLLAWFFNAERRYGALDRNPFADTWEVCWWEGDAVPRIGPAARTLLEALEQAVLAVAGATS